MVDITTASGRIDMITAVASALVLQLPLAGLLFAVAAHLLRLTVRRAQAADGRGAAPCRLLREPLFGVAGDPQHEPLPSGPAGMSSFTAAYFRGHDGVRLAYRELGEGQAADPDHGYLYAMAMARIAGKIAGRGHRVILRICAATARAPGRTTRAPTRAMRWPTTASPSSSTSA